MQIDTCPYLFFGQILIAMLGKQQWATYTTMADDIVHIARPYFGPSLSNIFALGLIVPTFFSWYILHYCSVRNMTRKMLTLLLHQVKQE